MTKGKGKVGSRVDLNAFAPQLKIGSVIVRRTNEMGQMVISVPFGAILWGQKGRKVTSVKCINVYETRGTRERERAKVVRREKDEDRKWE